MNVEVKQLKDTQTGEVFVPLTHWDAVANKPEDIAQESTSLEIKDKLDNLNVDSEDARMVAQFFGLPAALPEGYEFMTPEEVCSTLEDIMTAMDIALTPEMAAEITNNTLNN